MSHPTAEITPPANIKPDPNDCYLVENILEGELGNTAFALLRKEVDWQVMNHRGNEVPRLVAVQGQIDHDGSFPIYRHPADTSPPLIQFTPTVALIREAVEKALNHPVNHVLIQLYRDGKDAISEHSDKTIDVVRGSKIVNVSLGAQRTMVLRTKRDVLAPGEAGTPNARPTHRVPLPDNSMFVLGLETNRTWLHGINRDKRLESLKSEAERSEATSGERISLTFRRIGTFLSADETHIWGQGATAKTKETAKPITPPDPEYREDRINLIKAFSKENQDSDFNWDEWYGTGSDVLHLEGVE
ncbi:hypothetical protein DL93DRAFT_2123634 [Clavulina sp. PMI_390]|nr:hypothetical protein DL93DRAFT_2123634 [Clavulina sp. PMI_390]